MKVYNNNHTGVRKGMCCLLLALLLLLCLVACGKKQKNKDFQIYYLNMEETCIIGESHHIESNGMDNQELARLMVDYLMREPEDSKLRRTIASTIACNSVQVDDYLATVDMPAAFYDVTDSEDVLIRAAIVKTLTQIPGVVYISFKVDGADMIGRDGRVLNKMGAEDFVENPEDAIHTVQKTELHLYFADETGTYLKDVNRSVSYSSNTSIERLVMKQLIRGPELDGYRSTLPPLSRLISISVMDKVCYVNLDETFLNDQNSEITEQVVLYSIVNSLTSLPEVDKVQLAINGDTTGKVRYNYDLSQMYEFNKDILNKPANEMNESTEKAEESTQEE